MVRISPIEAGVSVVHKHIAADIISGAFEAAMVVGNFPATRIEGGLLGTDVVPNLAASKITSGEFGVGRIPNLAASKITSGEFALARLPDLAGSLQVPLLDDTNANVTIAAVGNYLSLKCAANKVSQIYFTFKVPSGFVSLAGAYIWVIPGNVNPSIRWSIEVHSAAEGDLFDHSYGYTLKTTNLTQLRVGLLDAYTAFKDIAADEIVGGNFVRWGTSGEDDAGDVMVLLFWMLYAYRGG